MKNVKKLSAAAAIAVLAAIPAVAGAPVAELPGANVGYVLSQVYGVSPERAIFRGSQYGAAEMRENPWLGALVGAA